MYRRVKICEKGYADRGRAGATALFTLPVPLPVESQSEPIEGMIRIQMRDFGLIIWGHCEYIWEIISHLYVSYLVDPGCTYLGKYVCDVLIDILANFYEYV